MSSESLCQVAPSWVDVGAFSREVYGFYSVSPEYFAYTLFSKTLISQHHVGGIIVPIHN
jgi:hypothetical protein